MLNVEFDKGFQTNLLCALLSDKEFMGDTSGKLRSSDFGTPALRLVYEVADKFYRKFGDQITPEALQMEAIGAIKGTVKGYRTFVGETDYAEFADVLCAACGALANPTNRNTNYFRDPKKLKRFIRTARIMAADSRGLDADEYVDELNRIQTDTSAINAEGFQFTTPDDFAGEDADNETLYGVGLNSIDVPTGGGMALGQYGILVAPTGVGKSIGMLNFALNNALFGRHSLTLTLENPGDMVGQRLMAMMSFIDARLLKKRNAYGEWPEGMLKNYRYVGRKSFPLWRYIYIMDLSGASRHQKMKHIEPTLSVIESAIGYWKEGLVKKGVPEDRCSFVYVDWIESINRQPENVRNAGRNDSEANLLKNISRELSAIARRTNTILWTACQVKSGSEDKQTLMLKDLAHSVHVADYCDVCIGFALADAGKQKFLGGGKWANEQPELSRNINVSFIKCRDSTSRGTYRTFYQGRSLRMWDKRGDMLDAERMLDDKGIERFYGDVLASLGDDTTETTGTAETTGTKEVQ